MQPIVTIFRGVIDFLLCFPNGFDCLSYLLQKTYNIHTDGMVSKLNFYTNALQYRMLFLK